MLPKLGEILIKQGTITAADAQLALEYEKYHDCRFGEALEELHLADEEQIARGLAEQLEIQYVDLDETPPSPECLEMIPAEVALEFGALPLRMESGHLVCSCLDPADIRLDERVQAVAKVRLMPAVSPESQLRAALRKHYLEPHHLESIPLKVDEAGDVETLEPEATSPEEMAGMAGRLPTIRIVDFLISDAIRRSASDIHIEAEEGLIRVRNRLDGRLETVLTLSRSLLPRIAARFKIMAGMDIGENRRPQDGGARVKVDGRPYELRVSTLPGIHGETVVARILDHNPGLLDLAKLGFQPEMEREFRRLLSLRQGMLLITGPTGSGKTTTLYAALNALNQDGVNIITVEDPVEYKISGITQVQVNERAGRTFAATLRSMVRQDPDIIMVGEIRDQETAEIGCRAALTGHLVLSTLHTQDAPGALARLFDIGVEPYIVTASLNGVLAQRLVRRICEECAEPYDPSPSFRRALEDRFGPAPDAHFRRGKGCPHCRQSGMKGRVGVYELVTVDEPMRRMMGDGASLEEIERYLRESGFRTMEEDAFAKACAGIVPPEEVLGLGLGLTSGLPPDSLPTPSETC